jgi:hypothetical protein
MQCCQGEPSLLDTLSDPIIQAVMAADHVDPHRLESKLRRIAARVGRSAPSSSQP